MRQALADDEIALRTGRDPAQSGLPYQRKRHRPRGAIPNTGTPLRGANTQYASIRTPLRGANTQYPIPCLGPNINSILDSHFDGNSAVLAPQARFLEKNQWFAPQASSFFSAAGGRRRAPERLRRSLAGLERSGGLR